MGKLQETTFREAKRVYFNVAPNSRKAMHIKRLIYMQLVENLTGAPIEPYKPLSPQYAKIKRKKFGNVPILYATGDALARLKVKMTLTKRGYRIAALTNYYMAFHLSGTYKMPKRNWHQISDALKKRIIHLLVKQNA